MFDVIAKGFSPEDIRCGIAWMCWISAVVIGPILAFSVTDGAGLRCPIAVIRMVHRIFLVSLSVALAYLGAYVIAMHDVAAGPVFLVCVTLFLSTIVSGLRHWLGLPVPTATNSWSGAIRAVKLFLDRPSFGRPLPVQTKK